MMNADDETNIANSFDANLKLGNASATNNLISEAFNLNSKLNSAANIQPFTVLPPSSNHFQPIGISSSHSRTPSADVSKTPIVNQDNQMTSPPISLLTSPPTTLLTSPPTSASSFFDQPNANTSNGIQLTGPPLTQFSANIFAKPPVVNNIKSSQSISPASSTSSELISSLPPQMNSGNPSTLFAPIPTKPSAVAPPISIPPPPQSTLPPPPPSSTANLASSSANPYSAKGALNKKVYDPTVVPVAHLQPPKPTQLPQMPAFNSSATDIDASSNLFVPNATNNMPQSALKSNVTSPPSSLTSSTSSTGPFFMAPSSPPEMQQINNNVNTMPTSSTFPIIPNNASSTNISFADQQSPYVSNQYQQQQQPSQMQRQDLSSNQNNKTMWNWFGKGVVTSLVEKAKHGVESIVTTIDPQMKDYMHPANKPFNLISTISNPKLCHTIRESFNDAGFSKITINATDTLNSSQFAPQIVGFACALQSAKEKLENTLLQVQQTDCVVLSFQDFLAELSTDSWFELAVIMLRDKVNNIDLTIYTEAIPVPQTDIQQLQQLTPADYPFKYSGFSFRLPEKNFNFNAQGATLNYDTQETILSQVRTSNALKTLAFLFKNRLISNMFQ